MHPNEVWVVLDAGKCTLDVVVAGVAVVQRVGNGKVPMPFAKVVEGIGEVERRFVTLVSPVVDGVGTWPWPEATIGERAWFAAVVEHVDQTLRREMNVESEVDERGVHNNDEAAFTLLDDGVREHGLVVADRAVVAVGEEGLEVGFGSGGVADGWSA